MTLADLEPAIALGPLDGRYRGDAAPLVDYLSEAALNRNRIHVEVEWFIHLLESNVFEGVRTLHDDEKRQLRGLVETFDLSLIHI